MSLISNIEINLSCTGAATFSRAANVAFNSTARLRLLSLRSSLSCSHRTADRPILERYADQMDQTVAMGVAERAAVEREREVQLLRQIDDAILAIDQGTYGVCEDCEEPISEKRLTAVWWAKRCKGCQEKVEEVEEQAKKNGTGLGLGTEHERTWVARPSANRPFVFPARARGNQ
jgi:RNA polymerase-binding transcription factor DksA